MGEQKISSLVTGGKARRKSTHKTELLLNQKWPEVENV